MFRTVVIADGADAEWSTPIEELHNVYEKVWWEPYADGWRLLGLLASKYGGSSNGVS